MYRMRTCPSSDPDTTNMPSSLKLALIWMPSFTRPLNLHVCSEWGPREGWNNRARAESARHTPSVMWGIPRVVDDAPPSDFQDSIHTFDYKIVH